MQKKSKTRKSNSWILAKVIMTHSKNVCRSPNTSIAKKRLFAKHTNQYCRDPWLKIVELLGLFVDQAKKLTQSRRVSQIAWRCSV